MDLINYDQKAILGTGYGLISDFALSTAIWCTFFAIIYFGKDHELVSNLPKGTYLDLKNRMTSFVHGVLILLLSGYHMYFAFTECGEANN